MATFGPLTSHGVGTSTPPQIILGVTPEMMATLQEMARESNQPLDVVFTRAIALYRATLTAASEGKHIGYATSADSLDVEFTGLTDTGGR